MSRYHLDSVFLPQGFARDVTVAVSDAGLITEITTESAAAGKFPSDAERIRGIVIPGMPNAHSHAFQRAMAGNTEYRTSAHDSFWTWRTAMYALANRIEPEDLEILATQLFVEMLRSGYTSVAEFHYLHRQPGGGAYSGENPLWEAIGRAADVAGIGLTFLPTLYQTSDFGGRPLKPEQSRFASDTEEFLRAVVVFHLEDARVGLEQLDPVFAADPVADLGSDDRDDEGSDRHDCKIEVRLAVLVGGGERAREHEQRVAG